MTQNTRVYAAFLATALTALFFSCTSSAFAEVKTYEVDSSHSYIGFSVKHLMISKVKGRFTDLQGEFSFDDETKQLKSATATIQVASINTEKKKRDKHLKSPDFFDVEKYPVITFNLKQSKHSGDEIEVKGDITIHGITKTITLRGEYGGSVTDPWGGHRTAFSASGKINRKDFGLTWNKVLETGGVVVGDTITLILEIEGIQKK